MSSRELNVVATSERSDCSTGVAEFEREVGTGGLVHADFGVGDRLPEAFGFHLDPVGSRNQLAEAIIARLISFRFCLDVLGEFRDGDAGIWHPSAGFINNAAIDAAVHLLAHQRARQREHDS